MENVRVRRMALLEKVKENRDAHQALYTRAMEGYRKLAIKDLEQMIANAREGKDFDRGLDMREPEDHTKEYDRVIAMLAMSQDDVIELGECDFARYVLDDWSWKELFVRSTNAYMVGAKP